MASPTQWTWVWVNSRSWWWTGRPDVLQSMGLQRVGYDWATELNWFDSRPDTLLQGGELLSATESWFLSNTWKWFVQRLIHVDKARNSIGKGCPGREQQGKGTQEDCSATWLSVSGFMLMGLILGLSLANHSDSESFPVAFASFSQGGFQREGFWEAGRTYGLVSSLSFDLSVGGGLLIPCSLPGPPVVRLLRQIVTILPWWGWVVLVSGFP